MSAATQPIMPSSVPSSNRDRGRPAEFGEHLFEPLPVGAAGAKYQRGGSGLRRARAQGGEVCPAPRGDQHQLFPESDCRSEFGVLDRAGDEGAVERSVEHGRRPDRPSSRSAGSAAPPESAGGIRRAGQAAVPPQSFPSSRSTAVPSARHRRARQAPLRATARPSVAHRASRRRPAPVKVMPRLCRSNSAVPISASSALTRCVTLDCTVLSSSAARVMPPSARHRRKGHEIGQFHGIGSVSL